MEEEWGVPYPDCVLDNAGAGFVGGAAAGTLAHLFTGLRDFPCGRHLAGAAQAVRDGAPASPPAGPPARRLQRRLPRPVVGDRQARRPARLRRRRGRHGAVARLRHGPLAVGRAARRRRHVGRRGAHDQDSVEEHDDDKPRRNQRPLPAKTKEDDVILRITPAIDHFPVPDPFIAASRGSLLRFRG